MRVRPSEVDGDGAGVDNGGPPADPTVDELGTAGVVDPPDRPRSARYPQPMTMPAHRPTSSPGRAPDAGSRLLGVDQLADRRDLAAELVVVRDLARDLVARMEDGGVVAIAELGADP